MLSVEAYTINRSLRSKAWWWPNTILIISFQVSYFLFLVKGFETNIWSLLWFMWSIHREEQLQEGDNDVLAFKNRSCALHSAVLGFDYEFDLQKQS